MTLLKYLTQTQEVRMRKFIGFIVAILLMIATSPIVLLYKSIKKGFSKNEKLGAYYYQLAVSTSQYYASFLYETEDWTTSSTSWIRRDSKKVNALRVFTDFLLGKDHCKNSYENERREIKQQGEQL